MVGRGRRGSWAAVLLVVCVVSAACTSSGSDAAADTAKEKPKATGVTWTPNTSRALRNNKGAAEVDAAAAMPDGTLLAGGQVQEPGAGTHEAAVWESRTGATWERVDSGIFDGAESVHALATDRQSLVAVGGAVEDDAYAARMWLRTPAKTWKRVEVRDPGDAADLSGVATDGGTTTVVGIGELDGTRRLVTGSAKTGQALTLHPVPDIEDPAVYDVKQFGGSTWIVGGAKVDGTFRQVLWQAPGDGGPWTMQVDVDVTGATVLTALAVHDGKLWAAGTWPAPDGTDRLGLWSSGDGTTWERVPIHLDGASTADKEPPGHATALSANDDGLMIGGSYGVALWIADGSTTASYQPNPASMDLAVGVDAIAAGPRTVTSFSGMDGTFAAASLNLAAPSRGWKEVTPPGIPDSVTDQTLNAIVDGQHAYGYRTNQAHGVDRTGGTLRGTEVNFADLTGRGSVEPIDGDLTYVADLEQDDERQVVVGATGGATSRSGATSDFNDIGVGQADGLRIKTLSTIGGAQEQQASSLLHVDRDWWIGGSTQPSTDSVGGDAAVWHSTDLEHWTAEPGDFAGARRRLVLDLCEALGAEWAVGSDVAADGTVAGLLWRRDDDGQWKEVRRSTDGAFLGCAGDEQRLVLSGGENTVTTSDDGTTFETRRLAREGALYGPLQRTPHGYVAVGGQRDHLLDRIVVWTSPDATHWTAHPSPTGSPEGYSVTDVRVIGDDLVLAGSEGLGGLFWTIHGLPL